MDLGCLDLGCISTSENQRADFEAVRSSGTKEDDSGDCVSANSKIGKNKLSKEAGQSTSSALNKFTSQIKKPPHRKTSPINWFPRKKVDSYLKRKIKMLQEVAGMNLTLDQTLGSSNPHYSKVLKEKMAAKAAAHKAMEARRAALVEASWCRTLRAASIPSEDAEAQLVRAEENAIEAFEAAQALGVIMYDMPNCPRKHCQIETSTVTSEGSSTHTVTASFETEFEVDKEVAAAVKSAFIRLANCPSFNKDEFRELLRKISQNPDTDESTQDLHEFSSEYESESGSELDSVSQKSDFSSQDLDSNMPFPGISQRKSRRRQSLDRINRMKLVDMMIERLKCLQEDELSSLATIVATCGLSSVLAEAQNIKQHNPGFATDHNSSSTGFPARRMSTLGAGKSDLVMDGQMRKKQVESELPSLDKFLVKRMTKLEREVQEAKNNRRNEKETVRDSSRKSVDETLCETIPDLGSILVKKYSKFEKDINEAKNKSGKETLGAPNEVPLPIRQKDYTVTEVPSLDKFLVKHVSRLEREVLEAKSRRIVESKNLKKKWEGKENMNLNHGSHTGSETEQNECKLNTGSSSLDSVNDEIEDNKDGLDKILIKPVHRLEGEKIQALSQGSHGENYRQKRNQGVSNDTDCESLDKILVKHVSRLEKEKMRLKSQDERFEVKKTQRNNTHLETNEEGGLDQILVKHKSRLEKEKMRLKSVEESFEVNRSQRKTHLETKEEGGLDQILVKHKPRLEREKMFAAQQQPENPISLSMARRQARERELQEAWGGLSLGNSMKPSLSKLERDKAAWIKAEEEERRQVMKAI